MKGKPFLVRLPNPEIREAYQRYCSDHLRSLDVVEADQTVAVNDGRCIKVNNLWLVGYGEWTGMASATLIGVSRTARATVDQIAAYLAELKLN